MKRVLLAVFVSMTVLVVARPIVGVALEAGAKAGTFSLTQRELEMARPFVTLVLAGFIFFQLVRQPQNPPLSHGPDGLAQEHKLTDSANAHGDPFGEVGSLCCAACSKTITKYHYDFESILMTREVGGQCRGCGMVLCDEHYSRWVDKEGKKWCPQCEGKAVWLCEGPAYSSMVDQEERAGSYNAHIRPPSGTRALVQE